MSEIKLLPCPCCKSEDLKTGSRVLSFGEDIYIQCNTCGLKLQLCEEYGWEELYKRWNTRKPMERIAERVHDITKVYLDARNPEESAYVVRKMDVINILKEEGGIE